MLVDNRKFAVTKGASPPNSFSIDEHVFEQKMGAFDTPKKSAAGGWYVELRTERTPHFARLPTCFDGLRSSHSVETLEYMVDQHRVASYLPELFAHHFMKFGQPHSRHRSPQSGASAFRRNMLTPSHRR
ncbi:hypothetical protein QV65_14570 [Rhodococcus erythropolis]|nr:hypothetical protein QV65_14570 [Rhodococcus erythropolis]